MNEHYIELPEDVQMQLTHKTENDIPDACPFFQNLPKHTLPELEFEVESRTVLSFQPRGIVMCVDAINNNPICNACTLKPGKLVVLPYHTN
jgi:hypothetical protein